MATNNSDCTCTMHQIDNGIICEFHQAKERDYVRKAGVERGINASIQAIEELRSRHSKRSSGYNDLSLAIIKLQALTVEEVEG